MKITRRQLESIVAEELRAITEDPFDGQSGPEIHDDPLAHKKQLAAKKKRKEDYEASLHGDKGLLDKLMTHAVDKTVGKIFQAFWNNRQKEKKKEAEKLKKKQQDKFDFADFEANFEPDDAAKAAASEFVKSKYQPPAEEIKNCMVQGEKYRKEPDESKDSKILCKDRHYDAIGQALKEPEESYKALAQQFKNDGVEDEVADIMAKPQKVVDKYERIMKAREKNAAKRAAQKTAYEKRMEQIHGKSWKKKMDPKNAMEESHGMKPIMESWRHFASEGSKE